MRYFRFMGINVYLTNTYCLCHDNREKKIEIIGKIIGLKDDYIIDVVNEILSGSQHTSKKRKPGWGKGMITYISDDFIPPGFPVS